jgi:DNA gyrase subunit A
VKGGVKNISVEDLVPDEESVLVLTAGGYVKRTNPSEYKAQKRGGVGVIDMSTKEEDVVTHFLVASAHSDLLFFTDKARRTRPRCTTSRKAARDQGQVHHELPPARRR